MSHLHLQSGLRSGFRLSTLALSVGMALMSTSGFALEALNDEGLAESTGEGVAFLPENFSMVFQGANDTIATQATDYLDRTKDTGYIRLIPVGPLTVESQDTNKDGVVNATDHPVGKADIYLYGLAISQSNKAYGVARDSNDSNNRFGRNIDSWGSAINPWLLKVATEKDVPNFSAVSPTDGGKGDISYLMLEAPLYDNNVTNLTAAEKSAYNLKLGLWGDIFVRDPKIAESLTATGTQFDLGGINRANRLRLQAVWDGFSLNGSNIKLFQTLDGATNQKGMSTFYNKTLGIAGVLRFNSGDATNLKATLGNDVTTDPAANGIGTPTGWNTVHSGTNSMLSTGATGDCGNASTGSFSTGVGCRYIVQNRTRTDTKTTRRTWNAPSNLNSVLRLSTQESGAGQGLLTTPAINGTSAPNFAPNEGLFIYNPNINLVLGSLYQPLTVGTDGQNITLEIARIPNKESIYKKVYTNYANTNPATNGGYYGSTCNIYQCGTSTVAGYQGSNATHSSISIGSVYSPDGGKTLQAFKGDATNDAIGISFGALQSGSISSTSSNTVTQAQYAQRQQSTLNWQQNSKCTDSVLGNCTEVTNTTGNYYQWQYNNGTSYVNSTSGWTLPPVNAATCSTDLFNGNSTCNNTSGVTPSYGSVANRTWSPTNLNGAAWQTASNAEVDGLIAATNGKTASFPATNTAAIVTPTSPSNNFGSAVIDGLLIQHFKLTTKGL